MTTISDSNTHVLCVDDSTSDDLDDILKSLFDDESFNKEHNLCSINSINWTRIMIQMVHYFWSYFRARDFLLKNVNNSVEFWPEINFSVPTGFVYGSDIINCILRCIW
jgi:threonine synthase